MDLLRSGWLRRTFSAPMMVALLALVVATSGTTYAALVVTGRDVKDGTLTTKDIRNRSLLRKDFRTGQLPRPVASKIDLTVVQDVVGTRIKGDVVVGPYTLRVECGDEGTEASRYMILWVRGPLGSEAQSAGIKDRDDVSQSVVSSEAFGVSSGGDGQQLAIIGTEYPFAGSTYHVYTFVGTVVLSNASQVITLAIDMTLDAIGGQGKCILHGTAVKTT